MAPVRVVWKGYISESSVTVVAKHWWRHNLAAFGLPLHAGKI